MAYLLDILEKDEKKRISEIGTMFTLLVNCQEKCYWIDSGDWNNHNSYELAEHSLFNKYFENVKNPSIEEFKALVTLARRWSGKNPYARTIEKFIQLLPKINDEEFFDTLFDALYKEGTSFGLMITNFTDVFTDLFARCPKKHEQFYKNIIYKPINYKFLRDLSTGIIANNFPRDIKALNSFPFENEEVESFIKSFIIAGYSSRLHKIGIKSGIKCAITESNNVEKPISVKLSYTPMKKQIGYEPAQIILQYVGSDIKAPNA